MCTIYFDVSIESDSLYHSDREVIIACLQLQLDPFRGVGILGFNSPEWIITNMAAIFAGLVSVVRFCIC